MKKHNFLCLNNWIHLFDQWPWRNKENDISKADLCKLLRTPKVYHLTLWRPELLLFDRPNHIRLQELGCLDFQRSNNIETWRGLPPAEWNVKKEREERNHQREWASSSDTMNLADPGVRREQQYGLKVSSCKEEEAITGEENRTKAKSQMNSKTVLQKRLHSPRWQVLTEGSHLL